MFRCSKDSPCIDGDEDEAGADASEVEGCSDLVGLLFELGSGFSSEMEGSLVGICSKLLSGLGLDAGTVGATDVGISAGRVSDWVSAWEGKAAGVGSGVLVGSSDSSVFGAPPGRSQPSRESGCSKTSKRLSNPRAPFKGPCVGFCSKWPSRSRLVG